MRPKRSFCLFFTLCFHAALIARPDAGEFAYSDSGSWTTQVIPSVAKQIRAISAVDMNTCWMAGDSGRVIRTVDGGATWAVFTMGLCDSITIGAIDAKSENVAFAGITCNDTAFILKTSDGGGSWQKVFAQAGGHIRAIELFEGSNGVAMGDPIGGKWTIAKTTDYGSSWARIATEPPQIKSVAWGYGFAAFDSTTFWFFDNVGRWYTTNRGGDSWSYDPDTSYYRNSTDRVWMNGRNTALFAASHSIVAYDGHYFSIPGPPCWPFYNTVNGLVGVKGTSEFWLVEDHIYFLPGFGGSWTDAPPNGLAKPANLIDIIKVGSSISGWATGVDDSVYHYQSSLTGAIDVSPPGPSSFSLSSNFPNPFNPKTTIRFSVSKQSRVSLRIYNLLGNLVSTLVNKELGAGNYEVSWDATNYPSGVYYYRMEGSDYSETKKLLLVR